MTGDASSSPASGGELARFAGDFLDEAAEHLATMEHLLVGIDPAAPDSDAINAIFRAVHSIKGASGMFGFADIAAIAHELETLLDSVRRGDIALDAGLVDAMLHGTDAVRARIGQRAHGGASPEDPAEVCERLRRATGGRASGPPRGAAPAAVRVLEVEYRAQAIDADALRELLAQLGELGTVELVPGAADASMRTLRLSTDTHQDVVRTLFEFVMDAGDVHIRETAAVAPAPNPPLARSVPSAAQESIRVGVAKVDRLINQVGELVISQAMLAQRIAELDPVEHLPLLQQLADLQRNTRGLQDSVMSIRMLPMATVFARFPRLVRDLSAKLGKEARVEIEGETTELDKGLIEKIVDPLVHLVRNAVDHGIEPVAERVAQGKPRAGLIRIAARHQGGNILIEVSDDGRGLCRDTIVAKARERGIAVSDGAKDREVWSLIFEPGFSTADVITDVSGRGVGLDVVKGNVASLGGSILLDSVRGAGTSVGIRLPLTLAIMDGLAVAVADERYIVPLAGIIESRQVRPSELRTIVGHGLVMEVRDEFVPVVRLSTLFGVPSSAGRDATKCDMVVLVETEGTRLALAVEDLLGQSQVVVKSLDANYRRVPGIAGATIMSDGSVACILDLAAIARRTRLESGPRSLQ